MNFKKLYDALAGKAKSHNENFTFMEGDPRKFGHGAPDPDWALMTIREGVKHGIVSQQQADTMSQQFEPHAKFEHTANGEVKVRAHSRNGKPVAAHTRSTPDGSQAPTDGRTPPFAPQHYPPLDTPARFPEITEEQSRAKYPNIRPLNLGEDGATMPSPMPTESSGRNSRQPGLLSTILSNMNISNSPSGNIAATIGQGISARQQGAKAIRTDVKAFFPDASSQALHEISEVLSTYKGSHLKNELLLQVKFKANTDFRGKLGDSDIYIVSDEDFNPNTRNAIRKSDYLNLLKILNKK